MCKSSSKTLLDSLSVTVKVIFGVIKAKVLINRPSHDVSYSCCFVRNVHVFILLWVIDKNSVGL